MHFVVAVSLANLNSITSKGKGVGPGRRELNPRLEGNGNFV